MTASDNFVRMEERLMKAWLKRRALKTEDKTRKEEQEAERLVRPAPSKKPPRQDRTRTRVREPDPDLSSKDPDLSLNYKDARAAEDAAQMPRWRVLEPEQGRENWLVVDDEGNRNYFQTEDEAEVFLDEAAEPGEDSPAEDTSADDDDDDPFGYGSGESDPAEEERGRRLQLLKQAPAELPLSGLPEPFLKAMRGDTTATDWDPEQVREVVLKASPLELFSMRKTLREGGRTPAQETLERALREADEAYADLRPLEDGIDLEELFPRAKVEGASWSERDEVLARQVLSISGGSALGDLTSTLQKDLKSKDERVKDRASHLLRAVEEEGRARAINSQVSLAALASSRDDLLSGFLPGISGAPPKAEVAIQALDSMLDSDLQRAIADIPSYATTAGLLNEGDVLTPEGRARLTERVKRDLELHATLSVLRRAGGSDFERAVFKGSSQPPFHSPKHVSRLRSVLWERPPALYAKIKPALPASLRTQPKEAVLSWFDLLTWGAGGPPPKLPSDSSPSKKKESSMTRRNQIKAQARTVGQPLPGPLWNSPPDHSVPYPEPEPEAVRSPRRLVLEDFMDLLEEAAHIRQHDPACRATVMAPEVACRIALDKAIWTGRYQHAVDAPSWRALFRMLYLWSEGSEAPPSLSNSR